MWALNQTEYVCFRKHINVGQHVCSSSMFRILAETRRVLLKVFPLFRTMEIQTIKPEALCTFQTLRQNYFLFFLNPCRTSYRTYYCHLIICTSVPVKYYNHWTEMLCWCSVWCENDNARLIKSQIRMQIVKLSYHRTDLNSWVRTYLKTFVFGFVLFLFVCLFVGVFVCLFVCLFICLFVCWIVFLVGVVCLFFCLFFIQEVMFEY